VALKTKAIFRLIDSGEKSEDNARIKTLTEKEKGFKAMAIVPQEEETSAREMLSFSLANKADKQAKAASELLAAMSESAWKRSVSRLLGASSLSSTKKSAWEP
jgi:hypothetical protein